MRIRHVVAALSLLVLPGCELLNPCEEQREVLEILYDDPFYEVKNSLLDGYLDGGYDCSSEGIRNAFGDQIGTKWTCTRCD